MLRAFCQLSVCAAGAYIVMKDINLIKKKEKNLVLDEWRRRVYFGAVLTGVIFFIGIAAISAVKITLDKRLENVEAEKENLIAALAQKEKIEGLYLLLSSRLNEIEKIRGKSVAIENIPSVVDSVIGKNTTINTIDTGQKLAVVDFTASSSAEVERVVSSLGKYKGESFNFSNPIVESTEIDEKGNYLIVLKLDVNKN